MESLAGLVIDGVSPIVAGTKIDEELVLQAATICLTKFDSIGPYRLQILIPGKEYFTVAVLSPSHPNASIELPIGSECQLRLLCPQNASGEVHVVGNLIPKFPYVDDAEQSDSTADDGSSEASEAESESIGEWKSKELDSMAAKKAEPKRGDLETKQKKEESEAKSAPVKTSIADNDEAKVGHKAKEGEHKGSDKAHEDKQNDDLTRLSKDSESKKPCPKEKVCPEAVEDILDSEDEATDSAKDEEKLSVPRSPIKENVPRMTESPPRAKASDADDESRKGKRKSGGSSAGGSSKRPRMDGKSEASPGKGDALASKPDASPSKPESTSQKADLSPTKGDTSPAKSGAQAEHYEAMIIQFLKKSGGSAKISAVGNKVKRPPNVKLAAFLKERPTKFQVNGDNVKVL